MLNPIVTEWLTKPDGLAPRLRSIREAAELSGVQLAERARWHQSKVSRLENGKQVPSESDIRTWSTLCDSGDAIDELLRLLGDVQATHLDWKRRLKTGLAAVQASYNELVEDSKVVRHFETAVVPGLLQTPDYARAILTEAAEIDGTGEDDIDQVAAMRLERQHLLYDGSKRFEFLLTEPVLRWFPCSPRQMRAQLDRLQTLVGLDSVRLGIIPLGIQFATTPMNTFVLYDDVAMVETFVGESTHTGNEAESYARILERLWTEAVEGDEARRLIIRAADELPSAPHD